MSNLDFWVHSKSGDYRVEFKANALGSMSSNEPTVVLIDRRVFEIYAHTFSDDLRLAPTIQIDATESTKSLEELPDILNQLLSLGVRRGDSLLAIGGGITQDIAAFLATVMFRGMKWSFIPTTLLAQADSCIGSKSSINAVGVKNILGTFLAPNLVTIDTSILETLQIEEMQSGIGEMLKVHAIAGPEYFDRLAINYDTLLTSPEVLQESIHASLLFKKSFIEEDEFDKGIRNVMNYGHSFGHAIETATDYKIPHGVAVTIGMDMGNFVAADFGFSSIAHFDRMHKVLAKNYSGSNGIQLDSESIVAALLKDKKNTVSEFRLILPNKQGKIEIKQVNMNMPITESITDYLKYSGRK